MDPPNVGPLMFTLCARNNMFNFIKKLFSGNNATAFNQFQPESAIAVSFDSHEIRCEKPNGVTETIKWDDLDAVLVETNDQGPFGPDVIWLLMSKDMASGCVYPQGATGDEILLKEMQNRLPGINNEMIINAMLSVDNQKFLIWEKGT